MVSEFVAKPKLSELLLRMKIEMKMAFLQNPNIFEIKIGVKKKCINGMWQMAQRSPAQNLGRKCLFGRKIRVRM